jgi:hypothetical protein
VWYALINTNILLAKRPRYHLKWIYTFDLTKVSVFEHGMKKEYPNVFQIKDKNEICIFEAENIAEWLKLINGAIEDLQKRLNRLGGARKISDQKVGDVCQSTDAMSSKFYD